MALTSIYVPPAADAPPPQPRQVHVNRGFGDKVFHRGTLSAGVLVLVLMSSVGLFLVVNAWDALESQGISFLSVAEWEPERGHFGIASLLLFTVSIAVVAVMVSFPIAMAAALFIVEIAPGRLKSALVAMVDLMAAVPSVVYGIWGLKFFMGAFNPLARWLATWMGWVPFFHVEGFDSSSPLPASTMYTSSTIIAGIVVAMMVMPIQCSIMREVFSQVPVGEREGAFALGATRWGMIRIVSIPFGRGGIIGGTMLGLGRALGETIAVALIVSQVYELRWSIVASGSNSIAAHIANHQPEASGFGLSALMAAGLALFALTLVVNFIASAFVARSRSGASSEA